jgi:DNA repair exonuclease SbcCD ATPase subunit
MKALSQLPFLKETAAEPPVEDNRVVELFRSRNEIKKQYDDLQGELNRQRDRLKQQEAATARVQEILDGLEQRLARAETGYPALAFYHLRSLWTGGRELLQSFVSDLARKQEERERKSHALVGNQRSFGERQLLEAQLRAAETAVVDARQALQNLKSQAEALKRFWHKQRRTAILALQPAAEAALADAEKKLEQSRADVAALESKVVNDFVGLSVESRRAINLATIAYAEVLCVRLAKSPLLGQAKAAVARREVADDYGTAEECERLMIEVQRARAALEVRNGLTQEVGTRVDRIKKTARYRSGTETVPMAESIAISEGDVMEQKPQGAHAGRLPNVIAEDSFDLFKVLLH